MVPTFIVTQPNPSTTDPYLQVSYRQIYFEVIGGTGFDPTLPMYCDIYVGVLGGEVYYKTLTSYSIDNYAGDTLYSFDIQDALQEYIQNYLPTIPVYPAQKTNTATNVSRTSCYCKFRGSSYSGDLLIPQPTVPIQGTATTPPIDGTGLASNPFTVINATINVQSSNNTIFENKPEYLLEFQRITTGDIAGIPETVPSGTRVFPLSNYPLSPLYGQDSSIPDPGVALQGYAQDCGGFPIIIIEYATSGVLSNLSRNCIVRINMKGGVTTSHDMQATATAFNVGTYLLPIGIPEIHEGVEAVSGTAVADALIANIMNPDNNEYYQICLFDTDTLTYVFFSPWFSARTMATERTRLAFQNSWGQFEWLSFVRSMQRFSSTSSDQFVPYIQIYLGPSSQDVGHKRMAITGKDDLTLVMNIPEIFMNWIKELIMSPIILLQVDPTIYTAAPFLQPYRISDSNVDTKKSLSGRINYIVTVNITPAVDYITLRN